MSEIRALYQTSNGKKFSNPDEAARYQSFFDAFKDYEKARKHLARKYAEVLKTADGVNFDFHKTPFWYVSGGGNLQPRLHRIDFFGFNVDVDDFSGKVVILGTPVVRYNISELYFHKQNAQKELLRAHEEWLSEQLAELTELEEEVRG